MFAPDRFARRLRSATSVGALAGLVVLAPTNSAARDTDVTGPATVACRKLTSQHWSASERWVWNCLCVGLAADFNVRRSFGGPLDPRYPKGWARNREVSPRFLREILLEKPYQDALPSRGVAIAGALFTKPVDLSDGVLV